MGREVRNISSDWDHPKHKDGGYEPLFDGFGYLNRVREWEDHCKAHGIEEAIEELGDPPRKDDYMPVWDDDKLTHIQMYENTSEGTPISPKFEKGQDVELAKWLVENKVSYFAGDATTFDHWLGIIDGTKWGDGIMISIPK